MKGYMAQNENPVIGVGDSDNGIEERVASEDLEKFRGFLGDNWDLILKEHKIDRFEVDCVVKKNNPEMSISYWKKRDSKHKSVVFIKYNGNLVLLREVEKDHPILDVPGHGNVVGRVYAVWDYDISQKFNQESEEPSLREIAEPKTFWTEDPKAGLIRTMVQATEYAHSIILYHDFQFDQVPPESQFSTAYIERNPDIGNRFRIAGDKNEYLFDYSELDYQHLAGFNNLHDETRATIIQQKKAETISERTAKVLLGLVDVNEHFLKSAQSRYKPHQVAMESFIDQIIYATENIHPFDPCFFQQPELAIA
jgi:hypothetical protein